MEKYSVFGNTFRTMDNQHFKSFIIEIVYVISQDLFNIKYTVRIF